MRKSGIALSVGPAAGVLLHYYVHARAAARCRRADKVYDYLQSICTGGNDYLPYDTYAATYTWLVCLAAIASLIGFLMFLGSAGYFDGLIRKARQKAHLFPPDLLAGVFLVLIGAFFLLVGFGGTPSSRGALAGGFVFLPLGVYLIVMVLRDWRRG